MWGYLLGTTCPVYETLTNVTRFRSSDSSFRFRLLKDLCLLLCLGRRCFSLFLFAISPAGPVFCRLYLQLRN